MNTAILVGVNLNQDLTQTESSLNELEHLAQALDIQTRDTLIQSLPAIHPKYYIGSGKLESLKESIRILNVDMVIFDDALSPMQMRHLEDALDVEIYDRSFLILSIFANRAKTNQAKLEVALAQKRYMYPRLSSMIPILSRQGGGYRSKGPGETQLELDKRKLSNEILTIEAALKKIKTARLGQKKKRLANQIPIVALVGYTNAGKSSLMNSLSSILMKEEHVTLEKNMLFTTLDTKSKRLKEADKPPFILIDTVGFISKLPHELVHSFESTLMDVLDADLILHVVDGAHYNPLYLATTQAVLTDIKADAIERILVLTKKSLSYTTPQIEDDYIFIDNHTKENMDILINAIYGHLYKDQSVYAYVIPYDKGAVINYLKESAHILNLSYQADGIHVRALLTALQSSHIQTLLK